MKFFTPNDLWSNLQSRFAVSKPESGKVVVSSTDDISKTLLGADSSLPLSNRFLYDPEAKSEALKLIKKLQKQFETKFDKTNFGKITAKLEIAVEELRKEYQGGQKKPKDRKRNKKEEEFDLSEADDLIAEIEEEAGSELEGRKKRRKDPGPSSFDPDDSLNKLEQYINKFLEEMKKFTVSTFDATYKAINDKGNYDRELGDIFKEISSDSVDKKEFYNLYIKNIAKIIGDDNFKYVFDKFPAYQNILEYFITSQQVTDLIKQMDSMENHGADYLERKFQSDDQLKSIFKHLADTIRDKGMYQATIGEWKVAETENPNEYQVGDALVSSEDLDNKYEEFMNGLMNSSSVPDKVKSYFNNLTNRSDMAAVLFKYMAIFFKDKSTDYKKMKAKDVMADIDKYFSGTDFVDVFKKIATDLELFTFSSEGFEGERFTVDQDASLELYESNGDYFANFYWENDPVEKVNIEFLGRRGYSNAFIKKLGDSKEEALQDLYKKIIEVQIKNELYSGRVRDPEQSKYRASKYFPEVLQSIEAEEQVLRTSRRKYRNLIMVMAQVRNPKGHASFAEEPLAKFTMSFVYEGVPLFVDFTRLSDDTFKITQVEYGGGDKGIASKIINQINNQTGSYNFDTSQYRSLSGADEITKRKALLNITNFYSRYLTNLLNKKPIEAPMVEPDERPMSDNPTKAPEKQYSKEQLSKFYEDFHSLSDKVKLTPAEQNRLDQATQVVSENLEELKRLFPADHDLDDMTGFMGESEEIVKSITLPEQNTMMKRLHGLQDLLDRGGLSKNKETSAREEIEKIQKFLIERADFSKSKDPDLALDAVENDLLDISIFDVNPSEKTKQAAIQLLKFSPNKETYKQTARSNLEKYPNLKNYLENIYSEEFVRLVYDNR